MLTRTHNFTPDALARFRDLQRSSFGILETMAASLEAGITEREVARELVERYRAAGFTSFFHLPVVLFGERTALPGDWKIGNFFPKARALRAGDSVVLDAAPISHGYLVDTSYSFCLGDSAAHRHMMRDLSEFRGTVCDAVNRGDSFSAIAGQVVERFAQLGYEPVHGKHPGEVLGHRALKFADLPFNWRLQGFDGIALSWFKAKDSLAQRRLGVSPLWNASTASDHAPSEGLWLVEPHAGKDGVGAKWEEILVIDADGARWLEAEPPHVRQWRQIAGGESYAPSPAAVMC